MKMFAIYDSKAEAYLAPIFCPTTAVALRMFKTAAEEEGHTFEKHAGDYTLFELGTWDEQTGHVTEHQAQINLGTALQAQSQMTTGHRRDAVEANEGRERQPVSLRAAINEVTIPEAQEN